MNLKKLSDTLRLDVDGGLLYESLKYQKKIDLEEGGIRPIQGGVGKSEGGTSFTLLKVVPSVGPYGDLTPDEIQQALKEHWDEIKNNDQLFADLLDAFKRVLAIKAKQWSDLYGTKDISVSLKLIKSSSDLAEEFVAWIPDMQVSGVNFTFTAQEAFEKGEDPKFDKDAYKDYLMHKAKKPLSEQEAEKVSNVAQDEWYNALARARGEGRKMSAHKDLPPARRYLVEYAQDYIKKTDVFEYEAMVDIIIDDFRTTGTSLRTMTSQMNITDGTVISVALFTK